MPENSPKKLVTWKQWVMAVSAAAVGSCLSLYREFRDTGNIQPISFVFSAVTFCFALCIIVVVFWYANRPE